jgi:predicted RNase H-like HicB family nuclease
MKYYIKLRIEIFKESEQYVGLCPELNVSSFGDTEEEAEKSIKEAISLFIEECNNMGTLEQVLEEAGYKLNGNTWIPREMIKEKRIELELAKV